jgi:hypothetical protein
VLKKFLPSAFSMTLGCPDSMTATQEFVVPRSIPTILNKNKYEKWVDERC